MGFYGPKPKDVEVDFFKPQEIGFSSPKGAKDVKDAQEEVGAYEGVSTSAAKDIENSSKQSNPEPGL